MDEARKQALRAAGIDVEAALARMMGSEALLARLLKKFLDDANCEKLHSAISAGDREAALAASHTHKGVCGNLSMTALFDLLTRQVAAFRAGDWEGAVALLEQIDQAYARVTAAIREACA